MTTSSFSTGKFCGYLLCSDFDGTLTCDGKTISRENFEAIKYFEAEGGLFTLATGRFPEHFMPCKNFGINTYVIGVNGSVIADISGDSPKTICEDNIDPNIIRELVGCLDLIPFAHTLIVHSNSSSVSVTPGDPNNLKKLETALERPVCKFIIVENPSIHQELRAFVKQKFPMLTLEKSWCAGLEGLAHGICKGSAVKKLRDIIGDIHTVVAVGDYENDISMIRYADIGYAVSNAVAEVKEAADRITVSNREHAIAAVIADFEK